MAQINKNVLIRTKKTPVEIRGLILPGLNRLSAANPNNNYIADVRDVASGKFYIIMDSKTKNDYGLNDELLELKYDIMVNGELPENVNTKVTELITNSVDAAKTALIQDAIEAGELTSTYSSSKLNDTFLKKTDADTTYATKTQIAEIQAGSADALVGYITTEQADNKFSTKEEVEQIKNQNDWIIIDDNTLEINL